VSTGTPVIVVGLDGSRTSWDAFSWALGEATRSRGRLVVVYVTSLVEPGLAGGALFDYGAVEQTRDELAGQLYAEAEQRARDCSVPFTFVRQLGEAAHALADVARSAHADLIVVGKSAKLLHQFTGSLGRQLVSRRDTPPVVVVP
jgi:nucleotide-binding universal stress UspA family protein